MSLLKKLKSILGLTDGSATRERERVGVTVERDPEADAEAGAGASADVGTEPDEPVEPTTDEPAVEEPTMAESTTETAAVEEEPAEAEPEEEEPAAVEPTVDEAVDEEPEEEAPPSEADAEPTTAISGIGAAYSDTLSEAGVETVSQLAAADASDLDERTGLGETRIAGWIEAARERTE